MAFLLHQGRATLDLSSNNVSRRPERLLCIRFDATSKAERGSSTYRGDRIGTRPEQWGPQGSQPFTTDARGWIRSQGADLVS
eukprot:scaffold2848_cov352-Pavlova_lutheri.AAC.52